MEAQKAQKIAEIRELYETQKAQKIEEIRERYKTDIYNVKNELYKADILKNKKLRDILFAKEIENFHKNENKQVQNLNDYIVSNIIDRLVNEIYGQITTNNCSFDEFSLETTKKEFFQLKFKIKNTGQELEIISILHSDYNGNKLDVVMLPPRKQLFNIESLTPIHSTRCIENTQHQISVYSEQDEYLFQFKENLGKNNKNKQPTLILEKDRNEYNIVLNNDDTITISKNNRKENDQQKLIDEIQSMFFKEDETKTLFENLEYELTDEQMKSYDKIKELLAYKNISAEQPKVKYSLCGKDNNWIGTKSNGSFGCCGW